MWWNMIVALLIILLAAAVLLLLRCRLYAVCPGANTALRLTVEASCDAPELESILRGLAWMRSNQLLNAEIIVQDLGLTPEAKTRAQILCRREQIRFIERE